ncbi:DegT/DnrJ/EryC1/StrS family aminotransferase [Cellulomonas hominis]
MTTSAAVPFVDLALQNRRIRDAVLARIEEVVDAGAFVLSPQVAQFEQEFAAYCEVAHTIGVGNGTDAIALALLGAGIGAGDEVIVPTNTFVATAEAVLSTGATLVPADCDENYLLDPASVAERLTPRTRAVVPVHLYGQTAPVEVLRAVVGPDVLLVEDAAQAQGARRHGRRAGSLGDVAATSFYPGKNLGAFGDAGAVMTSSAEVDLRVRQLRNHGGVAKYEHRLIGTNSRLDGIQAVVLSVKLAVLDEWNAERRAAADRYAELLGDVPEIALPQVAPGNEHIWHLYVAQVPDRDAVLAELATAGVGAGIHYPAPVHLLPAFAELFPGRGGFPVAEAQADRLLSLPMYPGITSDQQEQVAHHVRRAVERAAVRVGVPS